MKKVIISVGLATLLCSSVQAFDYNIVNGDQMLGAVEDINDLSIFKNQCVNYVFYEDLASGSRPILYNANATITGYEPLTRLEKGQGFIANATGDCTISTVAPDPNAFVFKGKVYSTITSPATGKIWLDRNLGALKVCDKERSEFASDAEYTASQQDCFGSYFQWGRAADGHHHKNSETTTTRMTYNSPYNRKFILFSTDPSVAGKKDWATNDTSGTIRKNEWSKIDGTGNAVCPIGYRVPTYSEINDEAANYTSFQNLAKLPLTSARGEEINSTPIIGGYFGVIWSSSIDRTYSHYSESFRYDETTPGNQHFTSPRGEGIPVRCIKGS